jgi:hypothetical protein
VFRVSNRRCHAGLWHVYRPRRWIDYFRIQRAAPTSNYKQKQLAALWDFLDDEKSAIKSLQERQNELFRRKAEIYWEGDQSGLARRQSDGRFDARHSGRSLNDKLAKLDRHFEAIENEIMSLRLDSVSRCEQQANKYIQWRSKLKF